MTSGAVVSQRLFSTAGWASQKYCKRVHVACRVCTLVMAGNSTCFYWPTAILVVALSSVKLGGSDEQTWQAEQRGGRDVELCLLVFSLRRPPFSSLKGLNRCPALHPVVARLVWAAVKT